MSREKDELISGSELAKRLGINRSYITNNKAKLKEAKCTYGNKYYFEKSSKLLGKNHKNPHESNQSASQKKENPKSSKNWNVTTNKDEIKKTLSKIAEKADKKKPSSKKGVDKSSADDLLTEIEITLKNKNTVYDKALLDGLKAKATITKTYYEAENEKIKNRKLEENLYTKDEVMRILGFAINNTRNHLINLPSNYAVNLEGLNSKDIKEYTTDDINKILEDLQNVGKQFE